MRAGRGFGVVLDAEDGLAPVAETFERLVVQVDVGDVDVVRVERIGIDREAVVVRGDFDALGELVHHGMVGAAVAELQLVGLAAQREAEDLMAEADAEDGRFADQAAHVVDLGVQRFGIAGAV